MINWKIQLLLFINILFFFSDFEDDGEDESDSGWQEELQRRYEQDANFIAELRARQSNSPGSNPNESTEMNFIICQIEEH